MRIGTRSLRTSRRMELRMRRRRARTGESAEVADEG